MKNGRMVLLSVHKVVLLIHKSRKCQKIVKPATNIKKNKAERMEGDKEVLTAYENPTKSKEIGYLLFNPKYAIFKE